MPENLTNEQDHHKENVIPLIGQYGKKLDKDTIEKTYLDVQSRYKDARIRIYVPLLAMRDTKEILSYLAGL